MKATLQPALLAGLAVLVAIPCAAQQASPARLTMKEAIQRGLQANLRVLAAGARIEEAKGTRERRRSLLLPRAHAEVPVTLQNRSLDAFGITVPGAPAVVGPFAVYDARLYVDQPLLNLESYHSLKASEIEEQAARHDYQDTRNFIVRQVAGLYLAAQAATARVHAAETRVETARALHTLADEQRRAGVATGVDVLRAEVQLANEQQALLQARNTCQKALLALERNIGMRPGTPIELADPLEFEALHAPEVSAAVTTALAERADYQSLIAQRDALVEQRKASRARYLPQLSLGGNYGAIGRTLAGLRGTGAIEARLSVTLFDSDREGERQQIDSRIQRIDDQMVDLRLGIEQQIRDAELTLESAAEEVQVAQSAEGLAQRELKLARDRFQAGVTNNIEVITAQDSLSRALENTIVALTRHADAKIALALALGATEQNYQRYLGLR